MNNQKIKIGIIGAGRLGGFHAAKVLANPEASLSGIYDPVPENRNRLAEKSGTIAYDCLAPLLEHCDACIIAAVSSAHSELGRSVLNAGRHLLMEKPLATSARDARELVRLADSKQLVFQAGHVEQYNPAWLAAEPVLSRIRQGEQAMIETRRTSGYTFRCTDIGVVLDLMIHDLELVLSLTGSKPVEIMACGFSQLGGHEDTAGATLRFGNGTLVQLRASRVEQTASRSMSISLAQESWLIDFQARTTTRTWTRPAVREGAFAPNVITPAVGATLAPVFMKEQYETATTNDEPVDALNLELAGFLSSILRKEPCRAPASRAAGAIEVAEDILARIG